MSEPGPSTLEIEHKVEDAIEKVQEREEKKMGNTLFSRESLLAALMGIVATGGIGGATILSAGSPKTLEVKVDQVLESQRDLAETVRGHLSADAHAHSNAITRDQIRLLISELQRRLPTAEIRDFDKIAPMEFRRRGR